MAQVVVRFVPPTADTVRHRNSVRLNKLQKLGYDYPVYLFGLLPIKLSYTHSPLNSCFRVERTRHASVGLRVTVSTRMLYLVIFEFDEKLFSTSVSKTKTLLALVCLDGEEATSCAYTTQNHDDNFEICVMNCLLRI